MLFNSFAFLVFLPLFLVGYYATRGRLRLLVILAGSYLFYAWWDWRFLSLILISTVVDYSVGLRLDATTDEGRRKWLVAASAATNLGLLATFKYFNFFIESFQALIQPLGLGDDIGTLRIILPVGISFYTFQTMSYTIDLFRRKVEVERSFLRFACFVAFFPQLVAGPIVRASLLLPQLRVVQKFRWDWVMLGVGQVLLGYVKKVAIADSLAPVVDRVFALPEAHSSLMVGIAVFFYAFQIYCDFSGYSDIAIGLGRILGFRFPVNFNMPYISRSFSEFWTRWHISLSSWLRDYLYIPLGGNRHGTAKTYRNLALTMLLGGLWHGAAWTFVAWGALHGLYLVVQRLLGGWYRGGVERLRIPGWIDSGFLVLLIFVLTCVAWVFFRSPDFSTAWTILGKVAFFDGRGLSSIVVAYTVAKGMLLIAALFLLELASLRVELPRMVLERPVVRAVSFAILLWCIAFFGTFEGGQFIYFQF